MADKKHGGKNTLSNAQKVTYQKEFKRADRAGGYKDKRH
ncbi:YfhE family protein [Metabacillus sp. GX 13764]|nr:YfhE family protein [Metabacillus kandeliae]MCD7036372.1 YfhE family protein [Metabacillus kandeliae]